MLVHVREENGRKIDDIDLQVKNMNHDVTAAEEEDDYDYDADMIDEVEDGDVLLAAERDIDGESETEESIPPPLSLRMISDVCLMLPLSSFISCIDYSSSHW